MLIPYEQQQAALNVVESLGYHFPSEMNALIDHTDTLIHQLSHHYHLIGGINNNVVLELHHRLLGGESTSQLSLEQLAWFRSQSQTLNDDTGITILKSEAHLLYLCAHITLQHGEAVSPLRWYFDIHLLITETSIDWNLVVDQAVALGWTFAIEQTLIRTVDFFSTPVPAWIYTQLQDRRPAQENVSRVRRLQGQDPRWEKVLFGLRALSFTQAIRLIFAWAFPAPKYIRHRYNIQREWMVWFYYFYRWYEAGRALVVYVWKRLIERINRSSR